MLCWTDNDDAISDCYGDNLDASEGLTSLYSKIAYFALEADIRDMITAWDDLTEDCDDDNEHTLAFCPIHSLPADCNDSGCPHYEPVHTCERRSGHAGDHEADGTKWANTVAAATA